MNTRKRYYFNIIFLSLPLLLLSCSKQNESQEKYSETQTKVTAAYPVRSNITEYVNLNGTTTYLKKEIIRSPTTGFIKASYKNIGDYITSGDILFTIKTKEAAAADSLNITIDNEVFHGEVKISAHSNGILREINYNTGDLITEGEQIGVISIPSSIRIDLDMPYQYSAKLNYNNYLNATLPDGEILKVSLEKKVPIINTSSQTQKVILKIASNKSLPESLNVNIKFPLREAKNVIAVPSSSILSNETLDEFWIMKIVDDTIAVKTKIEKGVENDSLVQLLNTNLTLTDRIVKSGGYGLPDSAKVKITD